MVRKVLISSFFAGCFFVSNGFGEGAVFNAMSASRDMERRIYAGQYRVDVNTLRSESGLPPVSHVAPSPSSASGTPTRPVVKEFREKEEIMGTLFWLRDPKEKTSTLHFARESDRKVFRVVYANSDSKDELKRLTDRVYRESEGSGRFRVNRYEIKDDVITLPLPQVQAPTQKTGTSPSIESTPSLAPGNEENSGTLFWLWDPRERISTLYFVRESDRKVLRVVYANSDSKAELKRLTDRVYRESDGSGRFSANRYEIKDDVLTLPLPKAEALPQTGTSRSIDFSPTLTPADALRAQRQVRERENRAGYYPSWDNSGNWAPMKWEPYSARRN